MVRRVRCALTVKHEPHEWYEKNVFRVNCPGLGTTAARVAARKESNG